MDDTSDPGRICRICRTGEGHLRQPCKCAGSIAYAHQECLEQWISVARKKGTCELCGYQFRFEKIYKEGTPDRPPARLVAVQAGKAVARAFLFINRLLLCGVVWLGLVPWQCIWGLRFSFFVGRIVPTAYLQLTARWSKSAAETLESTSNSTVVPVMPALAESAVTIPSKHSDPLTTVIVSLVKRIITDPNLAKDTFLGQMIAISAVVLFFGIFLLHEWVMQHAHLIEDEAQPMQPHAADVIPLAEPADPEIDAQPVGQDPVAPPGFEFTFQPETTPQATPEGIPTAADINFVYEPHPAAGLDETQALPGGAPDAPDLDMHDGTLNPEPLQDFAPALPAAAEPALLPHGPAQPGAPDANGILEDGDLGPEGDDPFLLDDVDGFLTAIGLRGPLTGLFASAGIIISLFSFLAMLLVALPYLIGRLAVTTGILQFYASLPFILTRRLTDPFVDLAVSAFRGRSAPVQRLGTMASFVSEIKRQTSEMLVMMNLRRPPPPSPPPSGLKAVVITLKSGIDRYAVMLEHRWTALGIGDEIEDRAGCILLGYTLLLAAAVFAYRHPTTFGWSQRNYSKRVALVGKAAVFGVIEVFAFPFLCGIAVSIMTLPFFEGSTLLSRIAFFRRAPLSATYLTWAAGSLEMFVFAGWLSMCREGLRPGAMFFIRDPQDMDTDPLHEFITIPMSIQGRKLIKSLVLYWTSIALGIGPIALLIAKYSPLRWHSASPLTSLPYELLVVRFLLPAMQRRFDSLAFEAVLKRWLGFIARLLCLSSFLFDKKDVSEEKRGGGGFALVPKIDHFKVEGERPAVIRATPLGVPISDEGRRKYESSKDNYQLVHLPTWFKVRVAVALYGLWTVSAWAMMSFPLCLIFIGRGIFATLGLEPHDAYSALLGFVVIWIVGRLKFALLGLLATLGQLFDYRKNRPLRLLGRCLIVLRTVLCLGIVLPLLISLYIQIHIFTAFDVRNQAMPTFALGYSWTLGVLLLATAERFLFFFGNGSFYGARLLIVYTAFGAGQANNHQDEQERQGQPQQRRQRATQAAAHVLLWRLVISHLMWRLTMGLLSFAGGMAAMLALGQVHSNADLRFAAAIVAIGNLSALVWEASEPWRKAVLQKSRDEAYLLEKRLLDRQDAEELLPSL